MSGLQQQWEELHEEAVDAFYAEDYEQASKLLLNARRVAEELGEDGRIQLGQTLNTLAGVYDMLDRNEEAAETNRQAWEILKELIEEDDIDLAGTARNVGRLYAKIGKRDEAMKYYGEALRLTEKSMGPDDPEIGRVYFMMASLYNPDEPAKVTEYREKALEMLFKDEQGDFLHECVKTMAEEAIDQNQPGLAREILERTLAVLEKIYQGPYQDLMEDPGWILNYPVTRLVIFRENYQEKGIEPMTMMDLRYLLTTVLIDLEEYEEAARHFEIMEETINSELHRSEESNSIPHLDFEDDDESEQDLLEDFLEEDDEEIDIDEDEIPLDGLSEYFLDRSLFFLNQGVVYHKLGQQSGERDVLERASGYYNRALEFISESDNPEAMKDQVAQNLNQLEEELKR